MVQRSSLLLLVGTLAVSACAGEGGVTQPTPSGSAAGSPTSPDAYLESVLTIMQTTSVNRAEIDWPAFRATVMERAVGARTVADVFPAILVALQLLDDHESYVTTREGALIGPPPVGGCGGAARVPEGLPDTVAYVKVASCDCDGNASTQFAESIQRAIESADRPGLSGWIVDLRGNFGGNMWPMIAGIGPVLGEGSSGGSSTTTASTSGSTATAPHSASARRSPVLRCPTGSGRSSRESRCSPTAGWPARVKPSSCSSRGAPTPGRSALPTCGHHHLQESFRLSDGATLYLATSQHADRTKKRYRRAHRPGRAHCRPGRGWQEGNRVAGGRKVNGIAAWRRRRHLGVPTDARCLPC